MKLKCGKSDFQKLVSLAERTSSKNSSLPILSTILIKTSNNRLILISTNLEVGFEASLSAKIEKEGEVAFPARTLLLLLSSITDEEITLETQNNNLKLISQTSSTNLKCFPTEDFPVLPKIKKENFFTIPATMLVDSLRSTLSATATSSTKPELASVYLFSQSKIPLTFVATDSFRLAEHKTSLNIKPISLLLPFKSAQETIKIFEEINEDIEIIFNKNQISFQSKNISFISRLTEGNFPDYQSIIPKSFLTHVVMDKTHLINSIKAASVFSSRLSEVNLGVNPIKDTFEIKASHSDTGEHHSLCKAKISGDEVEATFNYNYLLSALHSIYNNKILLGFNGPTKAVLIKGFENSSYSHLVMPMRGV